MRRSTMMFGLLAVIALGSLSAVIPSGDRAENRVFDHPNSFRTGSVLAAHWDRIAPCDGDRVPERTDPSGGQPDEEGHLP